MTALDEATSALRELEPELLEPTKGGMASVHLAERLRAVRKLLSGQEARWVGTAKAKRLLAVDSEETVKAWAQRGFLRSRTVSNGRLQVLLDDVLRRREETEGLSAIDGDQEISTEEALRLLRPRPAKYLWDHELPASTQ
jgi:hypothetical protein